MYRVEAEDVGPPTYRQLIDEALNEYGARHYAQAFSLFERAHELWPNARTLRGLGKVSFELEHYRAAIDYLEQARASTSQPLDGALRQDAERIEAIARANLSQIALDVEPANATLMIDGKIEVVGSKLPLLLDPGEHAVEARAVGYTPKRRSYSLLPAERVTWNIRLEASPPVAPSPRAVAESDGRPGLAPYSNDTAPPYRLTPAKKSNTLTDALDGENWLVPTGLTLAIAGAATVGVGAGFFVAYLDNGDKLRQSVVDTTKYEPRWLKSRDRTLVASGIGAGLLTLSAAALADSIPQRQRRWVTPTLLVVGTAALVAGISLYASNACTGADSVQSCSRHAEHGDAGSFLAMLSAPLLTIPVVHVVEWSLDQ
ncbi:MAG TPA: tetratricopeptide repeat protein [Polyangiales bacterium]|nr:tetratricopeptide repeat protein [Polyangiales bacterium]